MRIIIKKFPTHIAKTRNKVAPDKFIKVNNQSIYNSNLNRFARNIVMSNLHSYLEPILKPFKGCFRDFPVKVTVSIYTVKNHGSISRRGGKICWKPATKTYKPNWDIENLATIWIKAINDSLTKEGIIPDDNIMFIDEIRYKYHEVSHIDKRKLIIEIK